MRRFILTCVASLAFAAPDWLLAEEVRLPITRDNWFSGVGSEADGNNGASPKLKAKSIQEMSLLDFDPAPLRGRIVKKAALHWKTASPADPIRRVTIGTFSSEWIEGRSSSYEPETGASSFNYKRHPGEAWAHPRSQLTSVMLGQGGSVWRMADASPPDAEGWQHAAVEPAIVAARVSGVGQGLLFFDDTGTEWKRDGEAFSSKLFPNRYIYSRDSNAKSAPYLIVELGSRDDSPPAAPGKTEAVDSLSERRNPIVEAVRFAWTTPTDDGSGVVGFLVEIDGRPAPRWLIPAPGRPGDVVAMSIQSGDLSLNAPRVAASIRAVDGAGNVSPPLDLTQDFRGFGSFAWSKPDPRSAQNQPAANETKGLVKLGPAEIAIVDPLDKRDPLTGEFIPAQPASYTRDNHLWSGGVIRLAAARNEIVGFQIAVSGAVSKMTPKLELPSGVEASFSRYAHVPTKRGPLPDPLLPLEGTFSVPTPEEKIAGQKYGSLHAELVVAHDAAPGVHRGKLLLSSQEGNVEVPLELTIHNFALPDRLSFLPEMNCYGLPSNERDYYRLAHRHRTVLNRVPYGQAGVVADGCAPKWDAATQSFDWSAWDARFGPLFDGSLFADLPRKGTPIEAFYLPIHENWPAPMEGNFNGNYWADEAFPPSYRQTIVAASRAMAAHLQEKKWSGTLFQGFLNNKVDFKSRGWSRGSSVWLLDEPANWHDYWALKWFGEAIHEGWRAAKPTNVKLVYRGDVSRPEWQRDALDAVLDYNVVAGGAFYQHRRMVLERRDALGQIVVVYGGTNAVAGSNVQAAGWCVDVWSAGGDGVVPWQTIGNGDSWKRDDELSLFYPGESIGRKGPIPSIRLKAYLRGQQDVEYLALLQASKNAPRLALGDAIRAMLKLKAVRTASNTAAIEDAGVIQFSDLKPQDLWALRTRVASELAAGETRPALAAVEAPIPQRPFTLATPGRVSTEPPLRIVEAVATAKPRGPAVVLQGSDAVVDVVLDPKQPEKNLSRAGRDNRLFKNDAVSAWLLRFDFNKVRRSANTDLERATLTFYVWDPAGRGRTKVGVGALQSSFDPEAATWNAPSANAKWQGAAGFDLARDVGATRATVIVEPDAGDDVADPPIEYRVDVTSLVQAWLSGDANHGFAVSAIPDRSVDDGESTRFQVHSARSSREYGPKLTLEWK